MNLTIAVTPLALTAIARVLGHKKRLLLEGATPYVDQSHAAACEKALYLLMHANQATTGMAAMLREVAAIEAEDDEPALCNDCAGSGEGRNDGATCRACKGMGEVAVVA